MGIQSILLTGENGGIAEHADYSIFVPTNSVSKIQELHILIYHSICEYIEIKLFK